MCESCKTVFLSPVNHSQAEQNPEIEIEIEIDKEKVLEIEMYAEI